jgi:phosphopantothenoylcysteine decarboxylase/phosphopantothenate--cysteine ligase
MKRRNEAGDLDRGRGTAERTVEGPAKRVLLVVTGGIAAYKAADVVRELHHAGATVQVAMTRDATQFVAPLTFEALSGRRVALDLLPGVTDGSIDHIRLGRECDVAAVVPATANFIAKLWAGLADDLPSATLLALPQAIPMVLAPAMNGEMWAHPATRRNVRELEALHGARLHLVEPVVKELACGETGQGGLAEPAVIAAAILRHAMRKLQAPA